MYSAENWHSHIPQARRQCAWGLGSMPPRANRSGAEGTAKQYSTTSPYVTLFGTANTSMFNVCPVQRPPISYNGARTYG